MMTMTERWTRAATLVVVSVVAVMSAACASKSVNEILADPSRYRDRDVSVSGDVEESFSFGNRGVYRVNDSTGQLWVVSERGVPRKGARVKVTGRVREGFNMSSLGDRINLPAGVASGLVLVESSHRAD
jgi:hypothetical protein